MATHVASRLAPRARAWAASPALALDVAIAVLAVGVALALIGGRGFAPDDGGPGLDAVGAVLALGAGLPLLARRLAPVPAFAVSAAATGTLYGLEYSLGPPVAAALLLYAVAAVREVRPDGRPTRRDGVVLALLGYILAVHVIIRSGSPEPELALGVVVFTVAWAAGSRTRRRRAHISELEERAARAERESARERRLAAAEERTRIARDLHDSAGHAINVILVQAGAARLLHEKDPSRSRAALTTIEDVARETIGEIDRLVHALRSDGGEAAADGTEPPGLAALDGLMMRHRAAGLEVALVESGDARPLAPAVDRAAFRILQEALTNAARHGAGPARVAIAYEAGALAITVENPDDAVAPPRAGHGLVGMRERAALLGGTLEARSDGGAFRVRARLPVPAR